MGPAYFNKGETYQIRDYLSPGGFFYGGDILMLRRLYGHT